MTRLKNQILILMTGLMVLLLAAGTAGAQDERLVSKVDGFVYFLDHSGSMMMRHADTGQRKVVMAQELLEKMSAKIPALDYQAAMATFAPYKDYVAPGPYDAAGMQATLGGVSTDYAIFGRQTPMGNGLAALEPVAAAMDKPLAVIIVSDGENNLGVDPVAEAQAIYAAHPGVCFHVVSLADSEAGQQTLDKIAALKGCSVSASGPALLADEAVMDQFVRDVFFDVEMVKEEPAMVVVEEAAPMVVEEVITFRSVVFDFDKSNIRDDMKPILNEAASILSARDNDIVLKGHTDSIGPEEYNMGLSLRRAQSVKKYFESKGIAPKRMTLEGYGETMPKFKQRHVRGQAAQQACGDRTQVTAASRGPRPRGPLFHWPRPGPALYSPHAHPSQDHARTPRAVGVPAGRPAGRLPGADIGGLLRRAPDRHGDESRHRFRGPRALPERHLSPHRADGGHRGGPGALPGPPTGRARTAVRHGQGAPRRRGRAAPFRAVSGRAGRGRRGQGRAVQGQGQGRVQDQTRSQGAKIRPLDHRHGPQHLPQGIPGARQGPVHAFHRGLAGAHPREHALLGPQGRDRGRPGTGCLPGSFLAP